MSMLRIFLFAGLLLLLGCTKPSPEKEKVVPYCRDLSEILADGKLTALTDRSSTSYFVYKGTAMGFEYDLLRRFAKQLGVKLEIKVVEDMDCIIDMLEAGEGDIIAANYTVTPDRLNRVMFTLPILSTHQVLVQRMPEKWYQKSSAELDTILVRSPEELLGKTVTVRSESSFYPKLIERALDLGKNLRIQTVSELTTEEMIAQVAEGKLDFTVADENVARLNKSYFPNIDIQTVLSEEQEVAWAVRHNAPALLDTLNHWLEDFRPSKGFAMIHLKYFKARTQHKHRVMSEYSSLSGERISPYDEILKQESKRIGWDWKLLAAIIRRESNFKPDVQSPYGASGLMQLIPNTAAHFGADSIFDPAQNIHAGVSYLGAVLDYWNDTIPDSTERIKFALASYNVGMGHVKDAQRLTAKHGGDPTRWADVSSYLARKSEPEFYQDECVKHGYCRGSEPVRYVDEVMGYWDHYQNSFQKKG